MNREWFLKKSFHTITCPRLLFLFILLSFLGVSHLAINAAGAQEYSSSLSQITLTDSLCLEIQDGVLDGVLVDNFEYGDNLWNYGWNISYPPYYPIWGIRPYSQFQLSFDNGGRVLDVGTLYFLFSVQSYYYNLTDISKKAIYKDSNGEEHFIPPDFPVLNFEVKAPLAIEQFDTFRFEVEVITQNNGFAKIFVIPQNKHDHET